ncbi:SRPBCC family protein [Patulibacter minatonensis]|uniref:SRPBCC family protein n=1 Tax=Patulibacter minatonensis TaxID=298163 RepID=UPI00047C7521|nr:SRPBCC family protein [Patulibacter minatonensis]
MPSREFQIERSTTIAAPAAHVHPWIDDFHHWRSWSPWEEVDPALRRTYSGPASGVGAVYEWSGNRKAGAGRMEILGSTPSSIVTISLRFLKPFKAHNTAVFALAETGAGTEVRWTMSGPQGVFGRVFSTLFRMDKVVGGDFEKGLAALKAKAESGPPPAA